MDFGKVVGKARLVAEGFAADPALVFFLPGGLLPQPVLAAVDNVLDQMEFLHESLGTEMAEMTRL